MSNHKHKSVTKKNLSGQTDNARGQSQSQSQSQQQSQMLPPASMHRAAAKLRVKTGEIRAAFAALGMNPEGPSVQQGSPELNRMAHEIISHLAQEPDDERWESHR